MRALVIGGAGFIGSHLCDALLNQGHTIICVDNFSLGTKQNISHLSEHAHFILYEADAADGSVLETIVEKECPDCIFHLAANSDIQSSAADPDVEYKNTYSTTYHVLNCMRKHGVKQLFFASTSAVYGDKRGVLLDEHTTGLAPVSYYGAAKLGSESLISAFSYMNDMRSLVLRFPNVVGPRLTHGVIYDFIRKLEQDSSSLQILGDGRQTKPYLYVTDLIKAIVQFTDVVKPGLEVYNLGAAGSTSVTEIADILCEESGLKDVIYQYTGGEAGWKGDVPAFSYCLDKIHAVGWRAEYTSDQAVRKTIREVLDDKKRN